MIRTDLFFLLAASEIILDVSHSSTQTCIRHKGLHVLFLFIFHHLLFSFMMYGWLLPNKTLLLLFIACNAWVLIEWLIHRQFRLTRYLTSQCGSDPHTPFRDWIGWLGLRNLQLGGIPFPIALAGALFFLGYYLYRSS